MDLRDVHRVVETIGGRTMTQQRPATFPIQGIGLRGYWARRDVCPECGGELDTGWECNACGYDARPEAKP